MAFRMYIDKEGIPYCDYGTYNGMEIGIQHSVLAVAERGLWYCAEFSLLKENPRPLLSYDWDRYPSNRENTPTDAEMARTMLRSCTEWLVDEVKERGDFLVWIYPYPFSYRTSSGWCSAHAQAVGLQLLTRAGSIFDDNAYTELMAGLLKAFTVPIHDGGLCELTPQGNRWFEKIADPGNEQPRVLNGMMFTVLGLIDIWNRTQERTAGRLAEEGTEALIEMLPRYDLGHWSAYDIFGRRASPHYHAIHIRQLERLYAAAGRNEFRIWQDRFASY